MGSCRMFTTFILIVIIFHDTAAQTCGTAAINTKTNICCNGVVNTYVAGPSTLCCGTVAYNPAGFVCCSDGVTLIAMTSDPTMTTCCGSALYNSAKQICCNGSVQSLQGTPSNTGCCGSNSYNLATQVCSKGKLASKWKLCFRFQQEPMCVRMHMCIRVHPIVIAENNMCCFFFVPIFVCLRKHQTVHIALTWCNIFPSIQDTAYTSISIPVQRSKGLRNNC